MPAALIHINSPRRQIPYNETEASFVTRLCLMNHKNDCSPAPRGPPQAR